MGENCAPSEGFVSRNGFEVMKSRIYISLLLVLSISALSHSSARSDVITCTSPDSISNDIAAFSTFAHLAADGYGQLHLIWSSGVLSGRDEEQLHTDTIYYSVWADGTWTKPIDILADLDYATADSMIVSVDERLIVSWRNSASLFVSRADLHHSGSASNWQTLDMGLGKTADSDLFLDGQGNIHLVYVAHVPARNEGAVGYQVLSNGANNWSRPVEFFTFDGSTEVLTNVQVYVDGTSKLHVVWNRNAADAGWLPTGIHYSSSEDGGQTWTVPEEVFAGDKAAYPFVSAGARPGKLYLTWLRGVGYEDSKYLRSSEDNGTHWQLPELEFRDLQGLNGAMPIVHDSAGTEYWIMSGDVFGGSTGIHYSQQSSDSGWSMPTSVSSTLRDSEFPDATIINGNQLHIVWNEFITDDVYHVICQLDAPGVTVIATPVLVNAEVNTATPEDAIFEDDLDSTALSSQSTTVPQSLAMAPGSHSSSPAFVLILAALPAIFLVASVVVWHTKQARRAGR